MPLLIFCDSSKTCVGYYAVQSEDFDESNFNLSQMKIRKLWFRQRLIRKLSRMATHINNKELVSAIYSLVDVRKRFDSAKISCPKIFLISDNLKTVAEEAGKIPTLLKTLALGSNFLSAKCSF